MSSTTIPAAIDALITKIQGLAATQATVTPPVVVADGFPVNQAEIVVTIGGFAPTMATRSTRWAGLGAFRQWEEYQIHGVISANVGGDGLTPETAADAQKVARDEAFTVFEQLEVALTTDPTLAGSVSGLCGWVLMETVDVEESVAENAALGRVCEIKFAVKVTARI